MVKIQSIPFPYKAMLSVSSDLDETANAETYFETLRFLNTTEETKHGLGVGLEVGNTLYFDMPSDQFSYYNTDDTGRQWLHQLVQSGHIDTIHSFGDYTDERSRIKEILNELNKHNSKIKVWIDHAIAPSNLDSDIMQGQGNTPGKPAYHADLTSDYGVKYVWLGRVTSVTGQDTERRLAGIWSSSLPLDSLKTLGKEFVKGVLPIFGRPKYQMHVTNKILRPIKLADGSEVWEFLRSNPNPWGVSAHETGDGFAKVMVTEFLKRLVKRQGKSIIYTHLGKLQRADNTFSEETQNAWRLLKEFESKKQVLVCTTRRLLDYTLMTESINIDISRRENGERLAIHNPHNLPLDGLSITLPKIDNLEVVVNDNVYTDYDLKQNQKNTELYVPWKKLKYPSLK